jgi:Zn-dependent metalloprotease
MAQHADLVEHRELAVRNLEQAAAIQARREAETLRTATDAEVGSVGGVAVIAPPIIHRRVYTANGTSSLPGELAQSDGVPVAADRSIAEADSGAKATADFYASVFGRSSIDGLGLTLISTVHYRRRFDNAFWDGAQMVYGDGDATIFDRFTKCVDVIAHELTHGVTQYSARLVYHGQSGALNESVSDIFGSLVKQKALNQTAATADWLIGEGLFIPKAGANRRALRSLKAPGTAYDDPATVGRDPQPATMAGYVHLPDTQAADWGGIHINSGIPNRAFYEAAIRFGGYSWEKAAQVWYNALTGGTLPGTATFAQMRAVTANAARTLFDTSAEQIVKDAWAAVGV